MMVTKKCCICGYKFTFDNDIRTNLYISPKNEGASEYFKLWHFFVETCPECRYASQDIETTENASIVQSRQYRLPYSDILEELDEARPNRIGDYLLAGIYYESIGDELSRAKCLLQAGDLVYAEMVYWGDYIFDTDAVGSKLKDDLQYQKFENFAEELYDKGVAVLKKYLEKNPTDIDSEILLAGILSDSSTVQKMQGVKKLKALSNLKTLTSRQRAMVDYLLKDV